jgi:pimeloyl-ACP methyl ester carboxylesterase
LPKFCSIGEPATIASVQADFVEAERNRVLVRRWEGGGGPPVLYWHGGGGSSEELPHIAPALEAAGYSVYAPDAPGYGDSPALRAAAYHATAIAEIAAGLIEALAIAPVIWIGSSWGASIGIHAAVSAPGRVKALALLDGGYLDPSDDPDYDPRRGLAARIEELRARVEAGEAWDAPPEVVAAVMQGSDEAPPSPLHPALEAQGIPVLLVRATEPPEAEEIRAPAAARFRHALPKAEVVCVPAGHGVLTDAGPDVRRIVLAWLARLD